MTTPTLPAPDYAQIITLYQQLGQHLLGAMQRLSALHLQLGRDLLGDLSEHRSPPLAPWQHYQQQLLDILSLTHSNMLQTTHDHLTALERSMELASKAASKVASKAGNSVPRARVQTSVASATTHH